MILSAQRYDPLKRCGLPIEPVACVESSDSCEGKHYPNRFARDSSGTEWMLLSVCMPKGWDEYYPDIPDSMQKPLLDERQNRCARAPLSECTRDNGCASMVGYRYDVANRCRFLPEQAFCVPFAEDFVCSGGPSQIEDPAGVRWIGEGCSPLPEGWKSFYEGSDSPESEAAIGPLCLCEE